MNQNEEPVLEGYDYLQFFPVDQLYDLIESVPYGWYPLHDNLCQVNALCGSNQEIRELLDAIMWLKDNENLKPQKLFEQAAGKGILPAMKLLLKYYDIDPTADNNNNWAFLWASAYGRLEVLKWLWSLRLPQNGGWNIDSILSRNWEYLHAKRDGYTDVMEFLKSIGAPVH